MSVQDRRKLTDFQKAVLSSGKPFFQSTGPTVIYPTGPASGNFHPDHPNNPSKVEAPKLPSKE